MVNKLTKTKKGQLTMFMLLGIVILIIFGFIFYVANAPQKAETSAEIQKVTSSVLQSEVIKKYITSCLDSSLKDGLDLLGKQGGYIEKGPETFSLEYSGQEFIYLIFPPRSALPPPTYPCLEEPCTFILNKTEFPQLNSFYFGRFGLLPELDKYITKITGEKILVKNSIQEQLEDYILINTLSCINISYIQQRPELKGANLTAGNASVDIFFGENDVSAVFDYPLTLTFLGQPPITKIMEFSAGSDVRFKKIYDAIDDLLIKDILYLDYDIIEDTQDGIYSSDFYEKHEILKFKDILPGASIKKIYHSSIPGADIIIINDSYSQIDGSPFIFRFARANRRPVLDYIEDIFIDKDEEHTIIPRASDPDEDILTYSYSGDASLPTFIFSSSGYYNVIVNVSDNYLQDFQEVDVKVCDQDTHSIDNTCLEECGASSECHEQSFNYDLFSCDFNPYFGDICNEQCIKEQGPRCLAGGDCKAHPNCDGEEPYSIVDVAPVGKGWCYDPNPGISPIGCKEVCTDHIIDLSGDAPYSPSLEKLDSSFLCGCRDGASCDKSPYNLNFRGTCDDTGNCIGDY